MFGGCLLMMPVIAGVVFPLIANTHTHYRNPEETYPAIPGIPGSPGLHSDGAQLDDAPRREVSETVATPQGAAED